MISAKDPNWYCFQDITPKDFWVYVNVPGMGGMPERLKDGKRRQIKIIGPFPTKGSIIDYLGLRGYLRQHGMSFMHKGNIKGWYVYNDFKRDRRYNIVKGSVLFPKVSGDDQEYDIVSACHPNARFWSNYNIVDAEQGVSK
jgi:hypothetical protein